jgi:hypothetical protein
LNVEHSSCFAFPTFGFIQFRQHSGQLAPEDLVFPFDLRQFRCFLFRSKLEIPHAAHLVFELGFKVLVSAFHFGHRRCLRIMLLFEIPEAGRLDFEFGLKVLVSDLGFVQHRYLGPQSMIQMLEAGLFVGESGAKTLVRNFGRNLPKQITRNRSSKHSKLCRNCSLTAKISRLKK